MKSVVRLIMAALLMVMVSATATAQTTDTKKADRPRFNPEQFVEMRAKQIAQQLALDDATTAKFVNDIATTRKKYSPCVQLQATGNHRCQCGRQDQGKTPGA
jgi:Spy/CpxP family protein refolding chaperone